MAAGRLPLRRALIWFVGGQGTFYAWAVVNEMWFEVQPGRLLCTNSLRSTCSVQCSMSRWAGLLRACNQPAQPARDAQSFSSIGIRDRSLAGAAFANGRDFDEVGNILMKNIPQLLTYLLNSILHLIISNKGKDWWWWWWWWPLQAC